MGMGMDELNDFDFGFAETLTRSEMLERYDASKKAKVKSECVCPYCMEIFTKKVYQQAFHSTTCKDKFWNLVNDKRFARMKLFA